MGIIRGLLGPSPLQQKLHDQAVMQHQREQIRAQYAEPKEQQRREEKAAAEAMRAMERQHSEAVRQLAEQEKIAWQTWALEPRYEGGHADDPLVVTHHRSGRVPVIVLPPHAAVAAGDEPLSRGAEALIRADRSLMSDEKFMAKARIADGLFDEVRREYGPLLSRLRSESWWQGLCVAAGLADKKTEPHLWQGTYASGKEMVTTYRIPTIIGVRVASDGLRVRVAARLGDTPERWRKSTAELRAAFRSAGAPVGDLKIVDGGGGSIAICLMDADPLADPPPSIITPYDAQRGRSFLGKAADGSDIWVTIKNNASTLIAGMQGSGKTASLMPLVAGLAGHVEMHIIDSGASGEWEIFAPACASYDDTGELGAVAAVMDYALAASVERMKRVKSTGAINYWEMDEAQRRQSGLVPVVFVLEEAPQALGQGQATSDDKKLAETNMSLVGKAAKTIRKAGMSLIIITQKPAATEIPTIIRDNAGQRISFRLDSETAAATVFGDAAYVDPKPTSIPTGKPGRFIARVDLRGSVMGQAPFLTVDEIASYVSKQPRIPMMQLGAAPAPTATPGPFAGVEVGGGVTAPVVGVPQAVAEVPAPGVDQAPSPPRPTLDVSALTEEQRAALLTQLLSAPVVSDAGGEARDTADPEPTPDPDPPAAPTISGFDL